MEQLHSGLSLVGRVKREAGLRQLSVENSDHLLPSHKLSADEYILCLSSWNEVV